MKKENLQNENITENIVSILWNKPIEEIVSILSEVLINCGIQHVNTDSNSIKYADIPKIIIDDINKNGETLANALCRQGLLMQIWLNKE